MEIVGIGTDIIECLRIGRMIELHGERFLRRVYTEREIRYCHGRKHAVENFAGRWAAKEAIIKCLGWGWRRALPLTELEIRNDFSGKPQVHVCGEAKDLVQTLRIADILITISHCRAYATAYAIAVRADGAAAGPKETPSP